ncbi:MAG TPA: hypothetical protein VN047_05770 [Sphingopyxis sp.]|nr:hypothetical protein [Sphingopyxis sp.]
MTENLLDEIERFLAITGMKPTAFSIAATGGKDRHLVRTLRAGRQMWPDTQGRIRKYMTEYALAAALRDAAA